MLKFYPSHIFLQASKKLPCEDLGPGILHQIFYTFRCYDYYKSKVFVLCLCYLKCGHQSALFFYLCGTSCQDLHWIRQLIDNVKIYHVFGEFSHGA